MHETRRTKSRHSWLRLCGFAWTTNARIGNGGLLWGDPSFDIHEVGITTRHVDEVCAEEDEGRHDEEEAVTLFEVAVWCSMTKKKLTATRGLDRIHGVVE